MDADPESQAKSPQKSSFYQVVATRLKADKYTKHIRSTISKRKLRNLELIRAKTKSNLIPKKCAYEPRVSEQFLEEWINFPTYSPSVLWSTILLPTRWLLWTNKSIASLDPSNTTIRDRLCNSINVLGTAAGLFLVLGVAGFLVPPVPQGHIPKETQRILLDIYGILMFISMGSFFFYIGYALTALYPVLQSIRDDIAFNGFEHFKQNGGGLELYIFNTGFQCLAAALSVAAYLIYSRWAMILMVVYFFAIYSFVVYLSACMFISLDPISAMHLGLSNDPKVIHRAELMSHYILNKVPNHLLDGGGHHHPERRYSADILPEDAEYFEDPQEVFFDSTAEDRPVIFKHSNKSINNSRSSNSSSYHNNNASTVLPFDSYKQEEEYEKKKDGYNEEQHIMPQMNISLKPSSVSSIKECGLTDGIAHRLHNLAGHHQGYDEIPSTQQQLQLPTLDNIFISSEYLLQKYKVSPADAKKAFDLLLSAGLDSTDKLVYYLSEMKVVTQNCKCAPQDHHNILVTQHPENCESRRLINWMPALRDINIQAYTALALLQVLQPYLN